MYNPSFFTEMEKNSWIKELSILNQFKTIFAPQKIQRTGSFFGWPKKHRASTDYKTLEPKRYNEYKHKGVKLLKVQEKLSFSFDFP